MPGAQHGSLTKEPPLSRVDATTQLITPGMTYDALLALARAQSSGKPPEQVPHSDAPGLLRNRFLLVSDDKEIEYDHFLSLVAAHGIDSPLVRKVMYFVWAWRDDRVRRFIVEEIADKSGRWSATRAKDKKKAAFFTQFVTADSAKKARSNYEFFLTETGILSGNSVTLRPVDSWLRDAMRAAAQHEPDPGIRARMLADPVGTLFDLKLNALADLTQADRAGANVPESPSEVIEEETDQETDAVPPAVIEAKDWQDRTPGTAPPSTGAKTVQSNAVAQERARSSHLMLERALSAALKLAGRKAQQTNTIDMFSPEAADTIVSEIKSCTARNFHSQVRRGVSQLLEYRWTHRATIPQDATLVLLVETEPPKKKRWLIDYLLSLGIHLVWKEHGAGRLVMQGPVPGPLAKLFASV